MNAIEKASSDLNGTAQNVRQDLHSTIDKVADKVVNTTPPLVDKVATRAHDGVDRVGDAIEQASDTVASTSSRLLARGKEWGAACQRAGESGREYVRERPAVSLLIAAAAGYGLSKLLSSRK